MEPCWFLLGFVLTMNLIATFIRSRARGETTMVMEEKMEKIRIENLSVRYSDGNESLRKINLSIKSQ